MKRKLVKQGAATMMISLPSKWVRANNLSKGDELEIEEKGHNLIISLDEKSHKKETEIDLSSVTESSIRTILTNSYRMGYTKVKLNFKNEKALKTIQNTVNNDLIGFEIIKKSKSSCEVENITEPSKEQFDNIFSKIFLNIEDLFEFAEDALKGKNQEFEQTEQKIKQFDNFCRRVTSKNQEDEAKLIWVFHTKLIHAQREIYLLLKYLEENKTKSDNETFKLLESCKEIFKTLEKAYNQKSIPLLEKIHDLEKEITYKKGYAALKKNKNSIIEHRILNAARNFYLASSPLIGIFI